MGDEAVPPGEDPGAIHGDAKHWISVYQELLEHNRRLLERMRNHDCAEPESQSVEGHIQRLEARIAVWTQRLS